MTSAIFDDITRTFVAALDAGTLSLGAYSLPLLGAFALIGWYWHFGRELATSGGYGMGDALAGALLYAVTIGIAYWMLTNLSGMATAAYQTFLQWGVQVGGTGVSTSMVTPSGVVDLGFQIARPITEWAARQKGWAAVWNMGEMLLCNFVTIVIVSVFPLVAIALMLTQIEYHLAVMLGAVLIPFSVFGPTSFLAEFCIGWITGGLLRVLVTAVIIGIGYPLFSAATVGLTQGGDPTLYSMLIVALVSALYAGMAWWVPNKAATMCGRVALGLTGNTVVSSAMTLARFAVAGSHAIRGVSQMLERSKA